MNAQFTRHLTRSACVAARQAPEEGRSAQVTTKGDLRVKLR
jgi:hypothetical protein